MYDNSIKLIEMPEHGSISLCIYTENEGIFQLGERINERFEEAYVNGYNWDALIRFYVGKVDPDLMQEINTDPEAGMFSAYMSYSEENLDKMRRLKSYIHGLLSDEIVLFKLIEDNRDSVEWD